MPDGYGESDDEADDAGNGMSDDMHRAYEYGDAYEHEARHDAPQQTMPTVASDGTYDAYTDSGSAWAEGGMLPGDELPPTDSSVHSPYPPFGGFSDDLATADGAGGEFEGLGVVGLVERYVPCVYLVCRVIPPVSLLE